MHWFPSPALPTRWQLRRSSIKKKGRYSGLAARSLPYPDLSFSMESAPVLFWDFYTGSGCSFKRRGETPYPESHLPFYTLLRFRIGRIARFDTSTYNSFCSTSRSQFLFNCLPIKIAFASGILSIPVTLYVRSVTSKRSHPFPAGRYPFALQISPNTPETTPYKNRISSCSDCRLASVSPRFSRSNSRSSFIGISLSRYDVSSEAHQSSPCSV